MEEKENNGRERKRNEGIDEEEREKNRAKECLGSIQVPLV